MRITSNIFPDSLSTQLQTIQTSILQDQNAISSGLKVNVASDDPASYEGALQMRASQLQTHGYINVAQQMQQRTQLNYNSATQLQTIVTNASQLAIQAGGALNSSDMQTLSVQVNNLLEQSVALGNSQDSTGNYLFGGNYLRPGDTDPATTAAYVPFSVTRNGSNQITAVTYRGNSNVTQLEVAPGAKMDFNVVGSGSGSPGGLFINGASNVFTQLITLRNDLSAGNAPAAQATLSGINGVLNNVSTVIGATSANLDRLNMTQNDQTQQLNQDQTTISNLTSADYASTVLDLNSKQNSLQAALQAGSKILNLSLMNYLPVP